MRFRKTLFSAIPWNKDRQQDILTDRLKPGLSFGSMPMMAGRGRKEEAIGIRERGICINWQEE
jgi:hypothetical protein